MSKFIVEKLIQMIASRKYSEEQISETLIILHQNGGNVSKTSRIAQIPRKTICHWRAKINATENFNERNESIYQKYIDLQYGNEENDTKLLQEAYKAKEAIVAKALELSKDSKSFNELAKTFRQIAELIHVHRKYVDSY